MVAGQHQAPHKRRNVKKEPSSLLSIASGSDTDADEDDAASSAAAGWYYL